MNGLSTLTRRAGLTSLLLAIAVSSWAVQFSTVDDDFTPATPGWGVTAFADIQSAVAVTTGTVTVNPGVYPAGFNIDNKDGLTVEGVDRDTVIIRPNSNAVPPVYYWQTEGYTTQRKAVARVYHSHGTTLRNFTVDGINAMSNNLYLILVSESDGYHLEGITVKNNHVSDAAGGYSEFGIEISTAGKQQVAPYNRPDSPYFSCASRATGSVINCAAYDVGRVFLYLSGYTTTLVEGCAFVKDQSLNDFGYGIEPANTAEATIRNCFISGFGTPALSDNSGAAGIYVENAYSNQAGCTKVITIEGCAIEENQTGVYLGNTWTGGVAGTIPTTVNLFNNTIQNNLEGLVVTDANASLGSSMSLNASGNDFIDNDTGVTVFSWMSNSVPPDGTDSDISTTFTHNNISGSNIAIQTFEGTGGGPGSEWDLNFEDNNLFDNATNIDHNLPDPLDAEGTWWGNEFGPGPGDITGTGSGNVDTGAPSGTPITSDDDDDGLPYNEEDLNLNGVVDPGETDPKNPDTDGDGIIDGIDPDPLTPAVYTDADNDGQAAELGDTNDTNPDRDGDGFLDGYEVAYGTDPDNPNSKPELGDANQNGKVDNVDAVITFAAFLGNTEFGLWRFNNMDVDKNGVIDNVDAVLLLNFFLKNVTLLPIR